MTQPEPPPQVIIIGIREVLDEVRTVAYNQEGMSRDVQSLVSRFDIHLAEQRLRMAALEEDGKEHKLATENLRNELADLRQNAVTRPAMWLGIGTLATVGGVAIGALALLK